jgi:hypothetical protein
MKKDTISMMEVLIQLRVYDKENPKKHIVEDYTG